MLQKDCSAYRFCKPHALPGGKMKKCKIPVWGRGFCQKIPCRLHAELYWLLKPWQSLFSMSLYTFRSPYGHNSIYHNISQRRPSFIRNNSADLTVLKATSQTSCQLNLTCFLTEIVSAIVLTVLCVRIYLITCFLARRGEKNNSIQYFSCLLNFLSDTEDWTSLT